ncbi:hypothetical protein KW784_01720 [Candidatus Parcubacteria bacterium]|nr:hypothetical protein [Candidatus Parcubacteria bacterium]
MHKLHMHRFGLGIGSFVAFIHAAWALLVASGQAGAYISFILGMHFLSNPYTVLAFSWKGAAMLVVLTGIAGYVVGCVFACIWNRVAAK